MVTSILPFKSLGYQNYFGGQAQSLASNRQQEQRQREHFHQMQINEQQASLMEQRNMVMSRNFNAANAETNAMIHQAFDPRLMNRNSSAPLRTTVNYNQEYPAGFL